MLERILVPLDGSAIANQILTRIRRLVLPDTEVVLLRVVIPPPSLEADTLGVMERLRAAAWDYLRTVETELSRQGVRVRSRVAEGFPAGAILRIAAQENATLIAMPTQARTGLARRLFGSVTEKVLRASPVPVLAVPAGAREPAFRRILLPITAADRTLEAVAPVAELAPRFDAQVFLVYVCEGQSCSVQVPQMREAFDRLHQAGIPVDPVMKQGDPAAQILETCRETDADLIAMTTHGHSGLPRWLLGSIAEKVLRASRVPILVVRTAKRSRLTQAATV